MAVDGRVFRDKEPTDLSSEEPGNLDICLTHIQRFFLQHRLYIVARLFIPTPERLLPNKKKKRQKAADSLRIVAKKGNPLCLNVLMDMVWSVNLTWMTKD